MSRLVDWRRDAHGFVRLGFTGFGQLVGIVEAMHANVGSRALPLGRGTDGRTRGVARLVYRTIRSINDGLQHGVDQAFGLLRLTALPTLADHGQPDRRREVMLSTLNGVIGDHLHDSGNPLAIPIGFRAGGRALDLTPAGLQSVLAWPGDHLLVQVHGLCMSDLQWQRQGHDHGTILAQRLGLTPVQLRYNAGRHISLNGRDFARLLDRLAAAWPGPLRRITLLGHSMGGLVIRATCATARAEGHRWIDLVSDAIYLGSPHHGAPLERGGHWLQNAAGGSPYLAPLARLGRLRSAGITDLRHGNIADEDWQDGDRFAARAGLRRRPMPLDPGLRHFMIAATLGTAGGDAADRLLGDGLVPLASALGRHPDPAYRLILPPRHQQVMYRTGHLDLLSSIAVADQLTRWIAE